MTDQPKPRTTGRTLPATCAAAIAAVALATLQACTPADDAANAPPVADDASCGGMLQHQSWVGTVAYRQARDVGSEGEFHLEYATNIDLGAELAERTRRQHQGADYLVQYYSPLPEGTADLQYSLESYDHLGLRRSVKFTGNGRMQRQEPEMTEDGSSLSLTLNADDCTYEFHLQGQVFGSGEIRDRHDGTKPYPGPMWIPSVHGQGALIPGTSLVGSAPFPVLSRSQLENNQLEKSRWVGEMDQVARAMGEDRLGTVMVEWKFAPKD